MPQKTVRMKSNYKVEYKPYCC